MSDLPKPPRYRTPATRQALERGSLPKEWFESARQWMVDAGFREREIQALEWHDADGLTFAQVAQRWGVTREYVRQVYAKARRRLRRSENAPFCPPPYRNYAAPPREKKNSSHEAA